LFSVRSESMVFSRFDLFPQFASTDNVAVCIVDSSTCLGFGKCKREASLSSV
jgi:ABC-type polar amino acid transport system ATPase subunit